MNLANGSASGGVTFSLVGATGAVIGGGQWSSTPFVGLLNDFYTVSAGNTMTLILSGLTPSQPYDLYLYSSSLNNLDTRTTSFTIAASSRTAANVGAPGVFVEGLNYVHFSPQPADAMGQIVIAIQGSGGEPIFTGGNTGGAVSGFQIAPVPEPESIVLLALALPALAFVVARRRRGYLPCGLEQCN